MDTCILVICAFPNEDEAGRILSSLVKQKLAACTHVLPAGVSRYFWQGEIQTNGEFYALIKTTKDVFPALERAIRAQHSYDTPCIIAVPITAGHDPFLKWIEESVTRA